MIFLVLLFFTGAFAASVKTNINGVDKMYYDIDEAEPLFEQFIQNYGKTYENEKEKMLRLENFKENIKEINRLNMKYKTIFDINQFSDLTQEEFKSIYVSGILPPEDEKKCSVITNLSDDLASIQVERSFDWREKNGVTPVKDQGGCGSCWAFSIVGCLESQYAINKHQTLDLSEQQLLDCDTTSAACAGGWTPNAGLYMVKNGLMSEKDYPYLESNSTCTYDPKKVVAKPSNCIQFNGIHEEELKAVLVKYGPISISIDGIPLMNYKEGIFEHCPYRGCCNHAVLLVGYNTEGSEPYWILKNSWGPSWGENGYFYLPLGQRACQIAYCNVVALQL